ncbi:hypothetical protein DB88DRAFT_475510 [Papiliotrema laurentii]|uniref:Uncharacterized protein n=1 Tax=Papiliotrema laurentii TaxID=5418 RepID=A0AAD9CXK1_PAPLA|nr:hypothetical protein DB88DRAFT_475510 [Papiliotrema laurentii]
MTAPFSPLPTPSPISLHPLLFQVHITPQYPSNIQAPPLTMDDSDGEATTDGQCEWTYEGGVRCEHEALVDDVFCLGVERNEESGGAKWTAARYACALSTGSSSWGARLIAGPEMRCRYNTARIRLASHLLQWQRLSPRINGGTRIIFVLCRPCPDLPKDVLWYRELLGVGLKGWKATADLTHGLYLTFLERARRAQRAKNRMELSSQGERDQPLPLPPPYTVGSAQHPSRPYRISGDGFKRCSFVFENGQLCTYLALPGKAFCASHIGDDDGSKCTGTGPGKTRPCGRTSAGAKSPATSHGISREVTILVPPPAQECPF